jgi:AraC family transcriptional regulator
VAVEAARPARRPKPSIEDRFSRAPRLSPSEIVRRHSAAWPGLIVETVQAVQHKPFENRSQAPCHLLMVFELGERYDGETLVEGLPPSTLRNFTHKMTFVPAGNIMWKEMVKAN